MGNNNEHSNHDQLVKAFEFKSMFITNKRNKLIHEYNEILNSYKVRI